MIYKIPLVLLMPLTLLLSISVIAQEGKRQPPPVQETEGNAEVLDLLKAGLGPQVIIAKIKSSNARFDSSPASLQRLKAAGANDEIIVAVVEASASKRPDESG